MLEIYTLNENMWLQGFMYLLIYSSIQDKLEFTMMAMKMVSEMFVAAARFQVSRLANSKL